MRRNVSFIYLMLVCPFQVHARMSSNKFQKQVNLTTEYSMLERESHNDIHIANEAVEMVSFSNVTADEVESKVSVTGIENKESLYLKRQLASCVKTDAALRSAVKAAPKGKSTNIVLCAEMISLSSTLDPTLKITGIDITNKVINLSCSLPKNRRCNLDGAYRSRIFFGKNAKLTAVKVNFVKGSTTNDCDDCDENGGAIYLTDKSSLVLDRTSFMNNGGAYKGGAIFIENSSLVLKGGTTRSDASIFSNNSAYDDGAISASSSKISTEKGIIIFKNNVAEFMSGALGIEKSQVTLKNVNFFQNTAEYYSAAAILESTVKLENVVFVENTQDSFGALFISVSKADLKTVSFIDNKSRNNGGAAFNVYDSKVNMTNCVFNRNVVPKTYSGANLYILDDDQASSSVSCLSNNVFCSGLSSNSIDSSIGGTKTNCKTKGIAGKPGKGVCA